MGLEIFKLKKIVNKKLSSNDLDFKNTMLSIMNNNINFKPSDILLYGMYDEEIIINNISHEENKP